MNVFRFEFRKYLLSSLIWAVSLTFFGIICIQLFVSFTSDMKVFDTLMNAYSPEMLQAFGAQLDTIRTLPGFYGFCFMYVVAAGAFYATYLGIHVLGKELSGKSADFLFTKPISRNKILTMKLAAVIACLVLVNVIYGIGSYVSASFTNLPFDLQEFFLINGSMFLTQMLFLSFGFLLACILHKIKTPLSLTTGIVCAFFLLQMLVNLDPEGILSYFSFLNYLSADSILAHHGYELGKLCLLLGLTTVFFTSGYVIFQRRDIHAL